MLFFQITDFRDEEHFVNVETVAQIINNDSLNGRTKIILTNGNVIECDKRVYSQDVFKLMADAESHETLGLN